MIYGVAGFVKEINGYKILGGKNYLETLLDDIFIVLAAGNIRRKIYENFSYIKYDTLSINLSVKISSTSSICKGSIICAGCNLTVNVVIEEHR